MVCQVRIGNDYVCLLRNLYKKEHTNHKKFLVFDCLIKLGILFYCKHMLDNIIEI